MATLPANDVLSQDRSDLHGATIAPDFLVIGVDQIDADEKDRLREVNPARVEQIASSLLQDGQITPIHVCRLPGRTRYTLVAGAHRLAAARLAGLEDIHAKLIGADRDSRRLVEVLENLMREGLEPLDEARSVAELVAIKKRQRGLSPDDDGRKASIMSRWDSSKGLNKQAKEDASDTNDTMSFVYGWSEDVARECDFSVRKVERLMKIWRGRNDDLIARLREARHPALKSQKDLLDLVSLEPEMQEAVVSKLVGTVVNGKTIGKVSQAKALVEAERSPRRPERDRGSKSYDTIVGTLQRMSAAERLALFQSPQFHSLIPAEAQRLLAPMRRDPKLEAQTDA